MKTILNIPLISVIFVSVFFGCNRKKNEVKIANQIWSSSNLNTYTFRNGDAIKRVSTADEWMDALYSKTPAWCYYDDDDANGKVFGKLYNYYAVFDQRGLAPIGWHIPTTEDWRKLKSNVSEFEDLKSHDKWKVSRGFDTCKKCKNWDSFEKSEENCNECHNTRQVKYEEDCSGPLFSKFNGYPAGMIYVDGKSQELGEHAYWWATTAPYEYDGIWCFGLMCGGANDNGLPKGCGLSVRCIKD